eukprot:124238-Prymnesium_polylepis.2
MRSRGPSSILATAHIERVCSPRAQAPSCSSSLSRRASRASATACLSTSCAQSDSTKARGA